MNANQTLETERLIIRPWRDDETDRAFFHFIMSNEIGRKYYPDRKTRMQADKMIDNILIDYASNKPIWQAVTLKDTGQLIGFSGLCPINFERDFHGDVEIGWQFDPKGWGKGYATEAATALLRHAFTSLKLPDVVAFAIEQNVGSTRVMQKIGMQWEPENTFMHTAISDDTPHLKRHVLYRITAENWHLQQS